jgi:hypothetical protein
MLLSRKLLQKVYRVGKKVVPLAKRWESIEG